VFRRRRVVEERRERIEEGKKIEFPRRRRKKKHRDLRKNPSKYNGESWEKLLRGGKGLEKKAAEGHRRARIKEFLREGKD